MAWEGRPVHLELNALLFLCFFAPEQTSISCNPPRLRAGVLLGKGVGSTAMSHSSPLVAQGRVGRGHSWDIGKAQKTDSGSRGKHKKLIRGQGPAALTSLQEPVTRSLGDSEFQGKQKGPSLTLSSGPRRPAGFAFSLTRNEDSRPSSNFEKSMGDRKLELRRLMGLFIGAGGCLFWMPYKHPRYLRASHFPSLPLPQRGPRLADCTQTAAEGAAAHGEEHAHEGGCSPVSSPPVGVS